MAALATGVVQYMIDGIGFGWTFTIFGGSASISALLYFVEMKRGMKWRVGKQTGDSHQVTPTPVTPTSREEPLLTSEDVATDEKVATIV